MINKPDVYKSPASDTFIVFGEAKVSETAATKCCALSVVFKLKHTFPLLNFCAIDINFSYMYIQFDVLLYGVRNWINSTDHLYFLCALSNDMLRVSLYGL